MKMLLTLLATATVCLLPSVSQATCAATGTIPRVFVQASVTNIGVRENGVPAVFYNFTTTNAVFINTAVVAESGHITVQIVGDASACDSIVNGLSAGGNVVNILVSP
jgi:hypothetical protein